MARCVSFSLSIAHAQASTIYDLYCNKRSQIGHLARLCKLQLITKAFTVLCNTRAKEYQKKSKELRLQTSETYISIIIHINNNWLDNYVF